MRGRGLRLRVRLRLRTAINGFFTVNGYCFGNVLFLSRVSRAAASDSLLRRVTRQTLCVSHQQLRLAGNNHRGAVQISLADRIVFQMDQTTPADQVVLWYEPERREGSNLYCERVIGSIRRECLNRLIVLGESHLRRILISYFDYYHHCRPHLSLSRNSPIPREVELQGEVISVPMVGGLHHQYARAA